MAVVLDQAKEQQVNQNATQEQSERVRQPDAYLAWLPLDVEVSALLSVRGIVCTRAV